METTNYMPSQAGESDRHTTERRRGLTNQHRMTLESVRCARTVGGTFVRYLGWGGCAECAHRLVKRPRWDKNRGYAQRVRALSQSRVNIHWNEQSQDI